MADLGAKMKAALDECRTLVLGVQVLVGFTTRGVFEPVFARLGRPSQLLALVAYGALIVALALMVTPVPYDVIADGRDEREGILSLVRGVMFVALAPFAVGVGAAATVAVDAALGGPAAIAVGAGSFAVALAAWYGLPALARRAHGPVPEEPRKMSDKKASIDERVQNVLTETRVVLPGAQALLGFQLITPEFESFGRLPRDMRLLYIVCLALLALTTILLMVPAIYHRLVERGENSEHFHRLAGAFIVAAMVPFALALAGDTAVVFYETLRSPAIALVAGVVALSVLGGLWFGCTLWRRAPRAHRRGHVPSTA